MVRRVLLLAATLVAAGGASAVAAADTPVFAGFEAGVSPGTKQLPNSKGWGQVRPSTIFNGGDSGICQIHWISWGGKLALGTGIGLNVSPATYKSYPTRVVIVLGALGTWHGHPAYTRYTVSPPPGSRLPSPTSATTPRTGLPRCKVQKQIQ